MEVGTQSGGSGRDVGTRDGETEGGIGVVGRRCVHGSLEVRSSLFVR